MQKLELLNKFSREAWVVKPTLILHILSLPRVHFLIVYSREREDLKDLIMCNYIRFFVRHHPLCDEISQAFPLAIFAYCK